MKAALYQTIAWQILTRGASYEAAIHDALTEAIENEAWEPYTGEFADLDKRIGEFLNIRTGEIVDAEKLRAFSDAVVAGLSDPAVASQAVDSYVDPEGRKVPTDEVVERLINVVRGTEAPWPMSFYWQRTR
jgi:hypothetical protein